MSAHVTGLEPLSKRVITGSTLVIVLLLLIVNIWVLRSDSAASVLFTEWLPTITGTLQQRVGSHAWRKSREPTPTIEAQDEHPIRELMQDADSWFNRRYRDRSMTFKDAVTRYRLRHGRHPPPGFKEWYVFARERQVYDADDFQQINDDLRPFWAVSPADIRQYAAHASDDLGHGIGKVSLRNGNVFQELWGWRSETFVQMLAAVAPWLPDMDIPINRMDQPRVIVPWEDMQEMLRVEEQTRSLSDTGVTDGFTRNMPGMWIPKPSYPGSVSLNRWNPFVYPIDHGYDPQDPPPDYGWFPYHHLQLMDLAAKGCPPESYARNTNSTDRLITAEASYKNQVGGFIRNFNLSSDLCTVGPQLSMLHGMLYASTSMLVTHKLVPIFGECKVNVNNDILFPANMYWKHDKRYEYKDDQDINWDDKDDKMIWRGVTSGGTTYEDDPEGWKSMHRQRLVLMTNSTVLADSHADVLALDDRKMGTYSTQQFSPAEFVREYTDCGFTEKTGCIPNCDFYNDSLTMLNQTTFADTFGSKYLVDVDGHSFSGRWRAFLQSRSLGLKATIFREWHDSRLWAWKHFIPMDNRFDDLYSLLTYFIGVDAVDSETREQVTVPRHDYEAFKVAREGRRWAAKVLRSEDIEIYLFRLLLEYGRVIDDNRERIGFVGDGGREMEEFDRRVPPVD